MNVLIGAKEGDLLSALRQFAFEKYSTVTVVQNENSYRAAMENSFDLVVLHTGVFEHEYPWKWISTIRDRQPEAKIVVIPDVSAYDSLWLELLHRLADDFAIRVSSFDSSAKEIFRLADEFGFEEPSAGKNGGIVAAVWSASSKDGATTIAINTALALARHSPLKVGLLDLNLKNPEIRSYLHLADRHKSNLLLRPKMQTGVLNRADLLEACISHRKTPRLHVLAGTHRRDTAADVTPEMIEHLLDICRSTFDVTIADVSTFPDNAATVCTVKYADVKWLVAHPDFSSYRWSWSEWFECYWKFVGLEHRQAAVVLNRFEGKGETPERIASALGMSIAGVLPNVPGQAGKRAAQEGISLSELPGADLFADAVGRLASQLSAAAGAPPLAVRGAGRRNGLLTLLSGLFS